MAATAGAPEKKPSPLREITQPFIDVVRAPRALWGVNLGYLLEGLVYFGILNYLALYFSDYVFKGVANPNEHAHGMVMVQTAGITLAMLLFGFVPDKFGVRFALIASFVLMGIGRVVLAAGPTILGLQPNGMWSSLQLSALVGILVIVVGYGLYQPAAYAAVRKFTTPTTAGMGYAMLYALMNLGGWMNTGGFLLRDEKFLGLGIPGMFWVYAALTGVSLLVTIGFLTKGTVDGAIAKAKRGTDAELAAKGEAPKVETAAEKAAAAAAAAAMRPPVHMWILVGALVAALYFGMSAPWSYALAGVGALAWIVAATIPKSGAWLAKHPLADVKFSFFIFALIPVQTLFTYNWFIIPAYVSRAFHGWVGEYFEFASNLNALLVFIACPIVAALTLKRNVYNMMIAGTFVMAAPAFLLCIGPQPWALFTFIVLMTIGEAMWQPRFLQYAAEIAPEGRTGEYMGVAQFPWFLTKVLVPWLYSGWMMDKYCPADGTKHTELMWFIFGCIAMASTVLLIVFKGWAGKDFKAKAA